MRLDGSKYFRATRCTSAAVTASVRAGSVWVNTFGKMFQSTEMGGFKQSGLGRQDGLEGLFEYTELKHVNIQIEK